MIIKTDGDPEVFVFFSVDVIKSTEMKYGCKGKSSFDKEWPQKFNYFYSTFQEDFKKHLAEHTENGINKENLHIWKYAGDEILFYYKVIDYIQIHSLVKGFRLTMQDWLSDKNEKKVEVKGSCWLGQFPYIDCCIIKSEESEDIFDFVGPSIDCGFRIGKYSSKQGIVLSIELTDICNRDDELRGAIRYVKSENLKGVLGDLEYPIFILKLKNSEENLVQDHLGAFNQKVLNCFFKEYYDFLKEEYDQAVSRIDGKELKVYLESKKELKQSVKKIQTVETLTETSVKKNISEAKKVHIETALNNYTESIAENEKNK